MLENNLIGKAMGEYFVNNSNEAAEKGKIAVCGFARH